MPYKGEKIGIDVFSKTNINVAFRVKALGLLITSYNRGKLRGGCRKRYFEEGWSLNSRFQSNTKAEEGETIFNHFRKQYTPKIEIPGLGVPEKYSSSWNLFYNCSAQNLGWNMRNVRPSSTMASMRSSRSAAYDSCADSNLPFKVQGAGFRVQGAGFRVQGAGFRVQGAGCRVEGGGLRLRVEG